MFSTVIPSIHLIYLPILSTLRRHHENKYSFSEHKVEQRMSLREGLWPFNLILWQCSTKGYLFTHLKVIQDDFINL